ncbi:MAG: COX15/CtaA family protein [Actinomycetota bacterium]|nr:COX15/CtaA family protein [Actinomycetota bacterium]
MGVSRFVRPLGWASLVANIALVVTGGAVRLTDSGLGCPAWPRCTSTSFVAHRALGIHGAIEFGNRMIGFVLAVIAIATFVAAWQTGRRELRVLALVLGLGVPAQAVIGGIVVRTQLNPWLVSLHLLTSLAMTGVAVLFLRRTDVPSPVLARGPAVGLAWATFAVGWLVMYAGTVVTGAGPHAGDIHSRRNGLSPLQMAQLHADLVFLFVGLTVGLLAVAAVTGVAPAARRAIAVLLLVELLQGTIGLVQYFTQLPILLVGFHVLGAALISAAVTWALLNVRESGAPVGVVPVPNLTQYRQHER